MPDYSSILFARRAGTGAHRQGPVLLPGADVIGSNAQGGPRPSASPVGFSDHSLPGFAAFSERREARFAGQ